MPQKCCRALSRKTFLVIFYLALLYLFFAEYFQRKSWRYSTSWKCFSSLVFPSYTFFFSRLKMSFKVGFNPSPPKKKCSLAPWPPSPPQDCPYEAFPHPRWFSFWSYYICSAFLAWITLYTTEAEFMNGQFCWGLWAYLESYQNRGFCIDFLNHREGGMVFYQALLFSPLQCPIAEL